MAYIIERRNAVVGTKLNRWTIQVLPTERNGKALCRCDCGREKLVNFQNLLNGVSKRCRHCSTQAFATTHGASDGGGKKSADRLYRIWKAMKWRCNPKNMHDAALYHSRGISVCPEWHTDFTAFRNWAIANGYADHLTIDRWPDQNGNYQPGNCRWVDFTQQARNTRRNRLLTAFGETKSVAEWADDPRCAAKQWTVRSRLSLGWEHERAITTPSKK